MYTILRKAEKVFTPEFLPVNEVSTVIQLPAAGHPYVVVPCTFAQGKEGPFLMEVTCEYGFQFERLRKVNPTDEEGEGGRRDSVVD